MSFEIKKWLRQSKTVTLVTLGATFIAGLAAFLTNIHSIGETLGLTKEEGMKIGLRLTTVATGASEAVNGDISFLLEVTKTGADSARNCKIDINLDGSPFRLRNANYGTAFSLPAGHVTREVVVEVIPFSDNFITSRKARGAVLCDNGSSEEIEFRCSNVDDITRRAHC